MAKCGDKAGAYINLAISYAKDTKTQKKAYYYLKKTKKIMPDRKGLNFLFASYYLSNKQFKKGYKYYVDNLITPKNMTGEDMLKLQTIFHNNSLDLNDTIKRKNGLYHRSSFLPKEINTTNNGSNRNFQYCSKYTNTSAIAIINIYTSFFIINYA